MQLLGVVPEADFVVVGIGVGSDVRDLGHGDEVTQVVGIGSTQTRQAIHKLLDGLGVVPVAGGAKHVVGLLQLEAGATDPRIGKDGQTLLSALDACQGGIGLGELGGVVGIGWVLPKDRGIDLPAPGLEGGLGAGSSGFPCGSEGSPPGGPVNDDALIATDRRGCRAVGYRRIGRRGGGPQAKPSEQDSGKGQQSVKPLEHGAPRSGVEKKSRKAAFEKIGKERQFGL